jgi:flagellar motor switch protein FliG
MSNIGSTFSPGVVGGALRKGLQMPEAKSGGITALDGASRAAIVLMAMGPDVAGDLVKTFTPAEAQKVSSLLATVRSLDRELMIHVLEDFKNVTEHRKQVPFDPQSFVAALVDKFAGEGPDENLSAANQLARNVPALDLLSRMSAEQLHMHLQAEHPQVVATLLSLIPAELSAGVLEQFDAETRDELVLRIALLDQVDPMALVELNDMLERNLGAESSAQLGGVGGARPAAEILSLFSGGVDQKALANIRAHSPKLAEQIAERMFSFEDFVQIAPRALQELLLKVDTEKLAVALSSATENVQKFFFANMSQGKQTQLRFEMDSLPPLRVQEVEAMRREIVQIARSLEDTKDTSSRFSLERMGAGTSSGLI